MKKIRAFFDSIFDTNIKGLTRLKRIELIDCTGGVFIKKAIFEAPNMEVTGMLLNRGKTLKIIVADKKEKK